MTIKTNNSTSWLYQQNINNSNFNNWLRYNRNFNYCNNYCNSIYTIPNYSCSYNDSGMNNIFNIMGLLQLLPMVKDTLGGLLGGIFPFLRSKNTTPQADAQGVNANGGFALTSQSNESIAEANKNVEEINRAVSEYKTNGNVEVLKAEVAKESECQAQATEISELTVEPKQEVDLAQSALNTANADYKKDQDILTRAKTDEKTAQTSYESAKQAYDLASSDAPNKSNLEKAMQEAKQKWDLAKQVRKEAEDKLSEQAKIVQRAKDDLKAKQEALETAKREQSTRKAANIQWAAAIQKAKQILAEGGYISGDSQKTSKPRQSDANSTKQIIFPDNMV